MDESKFATNHTQTSIGLPAYRRIEEDIRAEIRAGRWPLGSRMPSRRELALHYGVQLPTLQRAVAALLADGTLDATARQGTVVSKVETAGRVERSLGRRPSGPASHIGRKSVGVIALTTVNSNVNANGSSLLDPLIAAVEATIAGADLSSAYFSRGKYLDRDTPCIDIALAHGVDALVIVLVLDSLDLINRTIEAVENLAIPVVFVTADPLNAPISGVSYDQTSAGYRAAQHLIQAGARKIIFLAPYSAKWLTERIEGAGTAVARMGFPRNAFKIFPEDSQLDPWLRDPEMLSAAAATRLAEIDELRGASIIASNDICARTTIAVAQNYGLRPGIDFQIVGFDDISDAREIGLTSIRTPAAVMGETAAQLALRQLSGDRTILQVSLQSQLVIRASTRPLTYHSNAHTQFVSASKGEYHE